MSRQEESPRSRTPHERLFDLLKSCKFSRELDGTHADIVLTDGVIRLYDMRKPYRIEGMDLSEDRFWVSVSRSGRGLDELSMEFLITGEEGLTRVLLPPYARLQIGGRTVSEYDLSHTHQIFSDRRSLQDPRFRDARIEAGHTLIDWVEEMRQKKMYLDPPISITPYLPAAERELTNAC